MYYRVIYLFPAIVLGTKLLSILPTDTDKSATDKYRHQYQYNIGIGGTLVSHGQVMCTTCQDHVVFM